MTNEYPLLKDDDIQANPPWMTVYISLMLVVLTLFIFLTTFVTGDKRKMNEFKEQFRKNLMMKGEGNPGELSISDRGTGEDPLQRLANRMKSKGINKKLMDEFLTLQQIKDLQVREGSRGVAVTLPEVVTFVKEGNGLELTPRSKDYLASLMYLVECLPYVVEIRGYSLSQVPPLYVDALQFSARRAQEVYRFFLEKNIAPDKLVVSGCGDAFENSDTPQNKVEIIFKSTDL